MAAARNRKHIVVPNQPRTESYGSYVGPFRGQKSTFDIDRPEQGRRLSESFRAVVDEARERRERDRIELEGAIPSVYVEFQSRPDVPLAVESLEYGPSGIELLAVRESELPDGTVVQHATVSVPENKIRHFLQRFEAYAKAEAKMPREKRHESMLDPVASLRLATLRALWTDQREFYPNDEDAIVWWEAWLRRVDDKELARLERIAVHQKFEVTKQRIQFADRVVVLIHASARQLTFSIDVVADLAELRQPKETAAFFEGLDAIEQAEWVADLRQRTRDPSPDAPAVCVLDTGVNRGHPLLEPALLRVDVQAVRPEWGTTDHHGHGTEMAGLALYGDLSPVLASSRLVDLRHRLESVKLLPPVGENKPELYGAITAEAASRAEIQAPTRTRCFAMAITATDQRDLGKPTSWSAAVDALAFGRDFSASADGLTYVEGTSGPQRPDPDSASVEVLLDSRRRAVA